MSDIAIRVENLGKKFRLRHQMHGRRYKALRDVLADVPRQIFSRLSRGSSGPSAPPNPTGEDFWALQNVSFEIKRGQAVGIIGRNGAGKSTLLKLLSRITAPTTGSIEIVGRLASLLEVGTGFHPELSGRENIFLNAAIMGMSRSEIKLKLDEIVAFAEVEQFLDTPVKHYSSGMYVRLAFAVAAHLEPEILIIDEVLAVGDMEFQKKCLGKMESAVDKEGRTVLFVSHNMDLISKLCGKAILLSKGTVEASGDVQDVVDIYLERSSGNASFVSTSACRSLQTVAVDEEALQQDKLVVNIGYQFSGKVINPTFGLVIYSESGAPIFGSNTMFHPPTARPFKALSGEVSVSFDPLPLWSGRYRIAVWLSDSWSVIDHEDNAVTFDFISPSTPLNAPSPKFIGPVHLPGNWTATA